MDHEVDRPTSLPLSHRISHVVVQLGFRTRPLRDGGGKPSPGRLVPPLRKSTGSHLWNRRSLTSRRNSTKLSKCLSPVVRRIIHSPMNYSREFDSVLVQHRKTGLLRGNPFRLAKTSGDPDWKYPLTLQEGVPIGVDEPTLTSPGVWPTKEELKGVPEEWEELPSPTGRHNYDSAEVFSDSIKETFMEEKEMGLIS